MIDAHNHLHNPLIAPLAPDLPAMGVRRAVVNGTRESDWSAVEKLAARHSWIIPSYGLHPWWQPERTSEWQARLRDQIAHSACAVGETGLDRRMQTPDSAEQERLLRAHLRLAAEWNRPITIHCVNAWGPLHEILATEPLPTGGFLLHAYSGSFEMAERFAKQGAYFSFNARLHAEKPALREMYAKLPANRLLVETDAPSTLRPGDGVRDRLQNPQLAESLAAGYQKLAEIRQIELPTLVGQVERNFARLFAPIIE